MSLSTEAATIAAQQTPRIASSKSQSTPAQSAPADTGGFVEIPLESLLPFLPETAVRRTRSVDANRAVRLPLNQVLPQLSRGRVVTPLGDVLSQLPAEMVSTPLPYTGSEKVILPLEHVVAHLSPDALRPRTDQREVELNDEDVPAPFSESQNAAFWNQESTPVSVETSPEETGSNRLDDTTLSMSQKTESPQVETSRLPEALEDKPLFEPIASREVQPTQAEKTPLKQSETETWRGQWVYVAVSDIVDAIPDSYLFEKRESLKAQVDSSRKVPIAIEDVVGQLAKGRITLRLGKIKELLPEGFLVPDVSGGELTIGIDRVIDQLPESAFTQGEAQQDPWKELSEIPTPFHEKVENESKTADEAIASVAQAEPVPHEAKATTHEEAIAEPVAPTQTGTVASDLLAEVNRIEPLFVEQSKPAEPIVPATPVPAPEKIEEAAPAIEAREIPAIPETPAAHIPAEAAAASVPAEAPVADANTGDEADLDVLSLAAEPPPVAATVSKETIAETLNHLNSWTEQELHEHNLGPTLTQRILEWRQHRGGFKDLRELMQIAGIGPKLFQRVLGFAPEALDDQARAINRLLGMPEDHEMSLQEIVQCASRLQGVEGCIVAMSDGIYVTGALPERFDTQRVSAFAPQLFARVGQYVRELNVGTARRFTIFTDAQPITIFKAGNLFFIVIHKANRFSKVLLNKCEQISQEISRLCTKESANQ